MYPWRPRPRLRSAVEEDSVPLLPYTNSLAWICLRRVGSPSRLLPALCAHSFPNPSRRRAPPELAGALCSGRDFPRITVARFRDCPTSSFFPRGVLGHGHPRKMFPLPSFRLDARFFPNSPWFSVQEIKYLAFFSSGRRIFPSFSFSCHVSGVVFSPSLQLRLTKRTVLSSTGLSPASRSFFLICLMRRAPLSVRSVFGFSSAEVFFLLVELPAALPANSSGETF